MPTVLRQLEPDQEVVHLQGLLSSLGYFQDSTPPDGIFEHVTHGNVVLFQAQHIDAQGTR